MSTESRTLLAFVALKTDILPKMDDILDSFAELCPDAEVEDGVQEDDETSTITCRIDDNMAAISLMPAPIPWEDLEGPCETAWWWPEAADELRYHSAHFIVALLGESGSIARRHVLISALVAAVVENSPAAGVYWGSGTLVHEPEDFVNRVRDLSEDNLLPDLWIDMRVEPNPDDSFRFFTTGLDKFDRLEIEVWHTTLDPQELLNFCYSIIDYMLSEDITFHDGETIGRTEDEKILITQGPSMFEERDGEVLRLSFP